MKIEAGKFYRTRYGGKVGPMCRGDTKNKAYYWRAYALCLPSSSVSAWFEDGRFFENVGNSFDLIAEWVDEPTSPVREVTRKIVPGVYGRLSVDSPKGHCVDLSFDNAPACGGEWASLNAGELRATAIVLTQLADALDGSP